MNQCGRLQRVSRSFLPQVMVCQSAKLIINEAREARDRGVAGASLALRHVGEHQSDLCRS